MNDGLKVIRLKKILVEDEKEDHKRHTDKARGKTNIVDPNGLDLIPTLLCYNCMNYGHSARDCKAPYCNQCEVVRPDHQSNICPNPKKKAVRRRFGTKPDTRKGKRPFKSVVKNTTKKGLKSIVTTSYQTDEDDEDSLSKTLVRTGRLMTQSQNQRKKIVLRYVSDKEKFVQ